MEKISQLMDGELEGQECSLHIGRLIREEQLAQRWNSYHLIRDVLRGEAGTRVDLVESVRARLRDEPTVLAPRRRAQEIATRFTMPVAAAVAGILIGGWWVQQHKADAPVGPIAESSQPAVKQDTAPRAVPAKNGPTQTAQPAKGQYKEFLLAHQEFSPTSAMQGAASYVRTISFEDADNAQ
jgi:sigma-E factor negative regulatory protein RseA